MKKEIKLAKTLIKTLEGGIEAPDHTDGTSEYVFDERDLGCLVAALKLWVATMKSGKDGRESVVVTVDGIEYVPKKIAGAKKSAVVKGNAGAKKK